MLTAVTLLVSRSSDLSQTVQAAHDSCDVLRLEVCGPLEKAHARIRNDDLTLILVHLTPELDGTAVRRFLRDAAAHPRITTALICSDDESLRAGRAMLNEGAVDLLCLPDDSVKLVQQMNEASKQVEPAGEAIIDEPTPPDLVPPEGRQLAQVRRAAMQDATILLIGETGSGKTVLARQIHDASPRRDRPFRIVDCGALSAELIDSELFGHVRGSFTSAGTDRLGKLAEAADGTLVLDEINSLPLASQVKLLRAVEERVFEPVGSNKPIPLRARIVAISNVPLEREVAEKRFRVDLFYRLNVVSFRLPALRDRIADVLPLARKFLADHPGANAAGIVGFTLEAQRALEAYAWPGNLRELRNVIERVVALSSNRLVGVCDLPEELRSPSANRMFDSPVFAVAAPREPRDEAAIIQDALRRHGNVRSRAARDLGISRVSLYKKLHKYGLFEMV